MTKRTRRRRNIKRTRKTRVKRRPKRGGNIEFDKDKFGEFITKCGVSCYDEDDFEYFNNVKNMARFNDDTEINKMLPAVEQMNVEDFVKLFPRNA
jgi:hypothetical protein